MLEGKQLEVCEAFSKKEVRNILVTAPAGTGKTFCCIQFAKKYIEETGIDNYAKILILTFSRNARAQLIKELSKIPRKSMLYNHIEINNYHSFMKNYIDCYRDLIGILKPINILDGEDFVGQFNYCFGENLQSENILADYDLINGNLHKVNIKSKLNNITTALYEKVLIYIRETGNICFAAFGKLFLDILDKSIDLARYIAHDYPIMMLDEFQDTDYFQYQILSRIVLHSKNLFFADDCQMIYDFRGASQQRLSDIKRLLPNILEFKFDVIYRYKNKPDIISILDSIRRKNAPDYKCLVNGELLSARINADNSYQLSRNEGLHTNACNNVFYSTINIVKEALSSGKSICILCYDNKTADKITNIYMDKKIQPRVISDTYEMMQLNKLLKKILKSNNSIATDIQIILSMIALCKNTGHIDDEPLDIISQLTFDKFKRKRKDEYRQLFNLVDFMSCNCDFTSKRNLLIEMLKIYQTNKTINYVRQNYLLECLNSESPTIEIIDRILLQKQYVNSFSDIVSGLYITTIHQSKGREFDYVCIVNIDNIYQNWNLLYVSHSRMKEKLFPLKFSFAGTRW